VFLGSLDEKWLCGVEVEGGNGEKEGKIERDGKGVGYELCKAKNHIWIENKIEGVTDHLEGGLYRRDREERWRIH
jgi:hypothetical protein